MRMSIKEFMLLLRWATARRNWGLKDVGILYHESGHAVLKVKGTESWAREAVKTFFEDNFPAARKRSWEAVATYNASKGQLAVVLNVEVPQYIH